jgi:hypothetical protein
VAITSLVFGLSSITIGWCYIGYLTGPVAIITGIVALVQIKNDPQKNGGKALALTGLITGALSLLGMILLALIWGLAVIGSQSR